MHNIVKMIIKIPENKDYEEVLNYNIQLICNERMKLSHLLRHHPLRMNE